MFTMTEHDPLKPFAARLRNEWLPSYCSDAKRRYEIAGYKESSNKVTSVDAQDFMWALDNGLLEDGGGGRYRLPMSKATVVIFWEGQRAKSPRTITLSMEPVITIASVARLCRDYGWPRACLGMESIKWEFDFTAFRSETSASE